MNTGRTLRHETRWQVDDRGLIFDALKAPRGREIAFFTSLCELTSGKILACYQNGSCKNAPSGTIRLSRSSNGGRRWSPLPFEFLTELDGVPGSLHCGEVVEAAPGRVLLFATWFNRADPSLPLFDPQTGGILPSRHLIAESRDEGSSWSAWRDLPLGELKGCALTGPAIRWSDGTLAVAFESFKEAGDPAPARHGAWIVVSEDGGSSFSEPILVARHPQNRIYYWDQRLCAASEPGRFAAMFWTHDLAAQRDLPVHFCMTDLHTMEVHKTPPAALPITGQIASPLICPDGRLLAFVVDRWHSGTMALWCSPDGGQTWPEVDRLVVYTHDERAAITQGADQVDFNHYWEDMERWSFGHPAIRLLSDGHILLGWYGGTPDRMSLHWARLRIPPANQFGGSITSRKITGQGCLRHPTAD